MIISTRRPSGGFTLLEVLVALALLGFVSVIAAGVLHLAINSRDSIDSYGHTVQQLRTSGMLLRSSLARAQPTTWRWTLTGEPRSLLGFADELHFVSPLPPRWADGRLYLFTIGAEVHENRKRLMLSYRALGDGPGEAVSSEPKESFVLIEEIGELSFAYSGFDDGLTDRGKKWHDSWERSRLPRLISIHVEPGERRLKPWPRWTVELAFGGISEARKGTRRNDRGND